MGQRKAFRAGRGFLKRGGADWKVGEKKKRLARRTARRFMGKMFRGDQKVKGGWGRGKPGLRETATDGILELQSHGWDTKVSQKRPEATADATSPGGEHGGRYFLSRLRGIKFGLS